MSARSFTGMSGALPMVALLGMVVFALGAFFVVMEPVDKEEESGPSGLALSNRHLALERTMTALGVPTSSRYGLGTLPAVDQSVVVFVTDPAAREPLVGRLQRWVESGGHLIVVAAREPEGLHFLDALLAEDAPPEAIADDLAPQQDTEWEPEDTPDFLAVETPIEDPLLSAFLLEARTVSTHREPTLFALDPTVLPPLSGQDELHIALGPDLSLSGAVDFLAEAEAVDASAVVVPVVHTQWGKGRVTALSDARFLQNDALDADGAALFWRLLHLDDRQPAAAALVLTGDSPSLLALLWSGAWTALVALLALVLAVLWRSAGAFGPPLRSVAPVRRSLGEHIEAVGNWHWRHHHHAALLDELRRTARARLVSRSPELAHASSEDFAVAVGAQVGRPASEIRDAFARGRRIPTRRDLTRIVATLQPLALGAEGARRSDP